ncbi:alpha/beta-hydrolase [Mycena metata]|uniref:Alpha/beta-hydrolase n=1 Tax=Mycena metata TaxID=1033252 RepID=A0AAD7JGJ2_9AGAR|nr:alpha/beta-hydrolase [Mycena metata]
MHPLSFICVYLAILFSPSLASSTETPFASSTETPGPISDSLYEDFVRYTKYSSAAYETVCPCPLGNTLVKSFEVNRTQGFVARDDTLKEIVVAFRGTFSLRETLIDTQVELVPFISPGLPELPNVNVHRGFLGAYNDVALEILSTVKAQLAQFPHYRLLLTGHSLGGAIAALAAVSLKNASPHAVISLYTFGQPRAGNPAFATYVEDMIDASNIFRTIHTVDGIPRMVLRDWGYEHFSTEYWQFKDPLPYTGEASTVTKCAARENPTCSDSVGSSGLNAAHTYYFGQVMTTNPLLCVSDASSYV